MYSVPCTMYFPIYPFKTAFESLLKKETGANSEQLSYI